VKQEMLSSVCILITLLYLEGKQSNHTRECNRDQPHLGALLLPPAPHSEYQKGRSYFQSRKKTVLGETLKKCMT
jgi:hypothetical protein